MKTSNYLPLLVYTTITSVSWLCLDGRSLAQGIDCSQRPAICKSATLLAKGKPALAQNIDANNSSGAVKSDLDNKISIPPNQTDKTSLTVTASITNRGEQTHYVYYIVAKFVAGETPLKETIVPVNRTIEPGETASVTHEISTESFSNLSIKNIKPVVIKSEYR